jgi:hypothetical protein
METHTDNNGFTVSQECDSIKQFLNMDMDTLNECVHIVPDKENRKLTFYRLTDKRLTMNNEENVRISLELNNVGILFRNTEKIPESLTFHSAKAKTILSFLECLKNERSDYSMTFKYYNKNNSPMIEEHNLNNESLFLSYKTETNRYNEVEISDVYANNSTQFANF